MYAKNMNIMKEKGANSMKKIIISMVNIAIFVLCFLFILSSFFKLISLTIMDAYIYNSDYVLICVWILGLLIAVMSTRPLYRWVLHLRYL